jgi:large subunit ribosomal protein L22
MDIIALQKFVRISPKKMRVVADIAKKMSPVTAIEKLPFLRKRGSEVLVKVIKSAVTNAKQKGLSDDVLLFKEIQIGEGPRLKRGRAASRGRWHPYKRRMSHVRVVLTTKEEKIENIKSRTKPEKGDSKQPEEGLKRKETKIAKPESVKSVRQTLKSIVSGKKSRSVSR